MSQARSEDPGSQRVVDSEPERARRTLSGGVLVFRWVAYAWMTVLNLVHAETLTRPALAWIGIAAAGLWTLWLTATQAEPRAQERRVVLWFDLALSAGLILISGLVVGQKTLSGPRLNYATAYPLSTALMWGAAYGLRGAVEITILLGIALVFSRTLNGISFNEKSQVLSLLNGVVNYLLAGGAAGVVSRHLDRSQVQLRSAIDQAIRERERAARLAERESLGRAIHDSVLQTLALVHKRGVELGREASVPGTDVLSLAQMASDQEQTLRALILREPEEPPIGAASLRDALEEAGRQVSAVPVTVSAVGPIWLPRREVEEIRAAVRQALENVVEHAEAHRAAVFAEIDNAWVIVSVRDDGLGFVYNEDRLHAEGKAGMLKSMKGRIEELGGRMRVLSAPGVGTEVEFRIPASIEEVTR
jgi:signal transduction histidine kinase